ncbi:hypothetical protein [Nibrella viscosa]
MKTIVCLLLIGIAVSGCAPSHYYIATAPVRIYADDHMTSRRLQDIPAGATLSVSDKSLFRSRYLIPVQYSGFRVYAYLPEAEFQRTERGKMTMYKSAKHFPSYTEPIANSANAQKHKASVYRSYPGGRVFYSSTPEINR